MNEWRMYSDAAGAEQEHLAWHEVLRAIAELNGSTHTLVHAAFGDHFDLVVAGGDNGQVLVQWKEYEPVTEHYVLTAGEPSAVMYTLTIEGNEIAFPRHWCLPLDQVIPVCGDLLRTCERRELAGMVWTPVETGESAN